MMNLSTRLSLVAATVGVTRCLADIGSDHGKVPVTLVLAGRVQRAVLVEIAEGPLQSAAGAVRRAGLNDRIDTRMGDGLAPLALGEADAIVIAGMGTGTIWDILTTEHAVAVLVAKAHRLILQPMGGAGFLRFVAPQLDYRIVSDSRVEDHSIIYECIELESVDLLALSSLHERADVLRQEFQRLSPYERMRFACGEVAIAQRSPLLQKQLQEERAHRERILFNRSHRMRETDRAAARMAVLEAECAALAELQAECGR